MGHEDHRDHLCLSTVVTVRAARPLEGSAGGGVADLGPVHDTIPDLPPLQPLASAIERGAVSREDAGQQCTVAGPLVVVGGGGGCFCCFAFCLNTTSVHIPLGLGPDVGPVVWEPGTAENEYPSPVQFSCALLVQTLVVPRLNFCLRLQCLGSFPVFARPPTH